MTYCIRRAHTDVLFSTKLHRLAKRALGFEHDYGMLFNGDLEEAKVEFRFQRSKKPAL